MTKPVNNVTLKTEHKRTMSENTAFAIILIPFLSLFFLFTVLPVLSSMVLSFFDYDMVSTPKFLGLNNYMRLFTGDTTFIKVFVNTLKFAVITGPLGFLLSFVLAWMINEFHPLVRTILTFLFYAPALVGNAYFIWQIMFSGDSFGYVNNFLISFGLTTEPIQWFKNAEYNMTIIMVIQLWMGMGVSFLSNIAGLQNVNTELYEAGAIDGIKTRWHELWYITLPSMKDILFFSAIMQIQAVFSIGTIITTLAGYPSVNNSVDSIVSYISDVGTTRYEMGYASTISVILFMVILLFRYVVLALLKLVGKSSSK